MASISEKIADAIRPTKRRYTVVDVDEESELAIVRTRRQRFAKITLLVTPIWLLLLYLSLHQPAGSAPSVRQTTLNSVESAFVHLLLPAPSGSTPFCRTLFSAGALNYPTPRIINWGWEAKRGSFELGKISGVLDFLKKLGGAHDEELVIVADGSDTWFQLRPEVLLGRYFAINERTRSTVWPRYELKYEQNILFSAQRNCEGGKDAWSCSVVPPSPLPHNVYGKQADSNQGDGMDQYALTRPRFLNTGLIIGPVKSMRALYEYAQWKIEHKTFQNEQQIFSEVFGEQEYYREMMRAHKQVTSSSKAVPDPRDGRVNSTIIDLPCDRCQFGIGLDYRSELSLSGTHAGDTLARVQFKRDRKHQLSNDIRQSTPPYWTPDYSGANHFPRKDWEDVALQTDKFTGITPAAIHYEKSDNTSDQWPKQWYAGDLRALAEGHAKSFRIPFAIIRQNDGKVKEYWGPNDGYGGARLHEKSMPGKWQQWDELCGSEEIGKEVFLDGKGAFQCPVYFLYWDGKKQNAQLNEWAGRIEQGDPT